MKNSRTNTRICPTSFGRQCPDGGTVAVEMQPPILTPAQVRAILKEAGAPMRLMALEVFAGNPARAYRFTLEGGKDYDWFYKNPVEQMLGRPIWSTPEEFASDRWETSTFGIPLRACVRPKLFEIATQIGAPKIRRGCANGIYMSRARLRAAILSHQASLNSKPATPAKPPEPK